MKVAQINAYGGSDVLQIHDVPKPSAAKGQVVVAVHAASINPFDVKLMAGYMKEHIPLKFPVTMGGDFSGVVTQLGEGVTAFHVGDEIYGTATVLSGASGAYAEFATVNVMKAALKPTSASFEEAAAVALVGASAVQALEEHIKLQKGQKILIHGGAGGIGHIAIQLAKSMGAFVATTVSTDDVAFAKALGADEVIDYKTQDFMALVKDYDAVFDTVGGEVPTRSFHVLKNGGVIVSMVGKPDAGHAAEHGITAIGQGTETNAAHFTRVSELFDAGKIKINIDKTFALDKVKDAYDYQKQHSPRGKVVLKIT